MEKCTGYEEGGSLSQEVRKRLTGSKALNCETMRHQHRIRQFEYSRILVINGSQILIRSKYNRIGTYVLTKTHGYVRSIGILYNGHGVILTRGKEASHPFLPIHNQIGSAHSCHSNRPRADSCKGMAHIPSSSHNYHQVLAENLETKTREENTHVPMAINT